MTDGILLAETQSDPLLRAYDTIIVDEAHERSLNIDFLLGHLRQILPRRPDLRVDRHLGDDRRRALRRPLRERRRAGAGDPGLGAAVPGRDPLAAVRREPRPRPRRRDLRRRRRALARRGRRSGSGDVLVFLPGEREIRDAAERLRKHHPPGVEVLPLFARLSPAAAGRGLRAAQRAPHRPRHQRRRDLADRAGHPLRHRRRHGAHQALQLSQQGRAAADRADQPGGGEPARRPLRPRRRRHLHPPLRRGRLRRAAEVHRPGDRALVAGRRDPAHAVAQPRQRRGLPVPRGAAASARSPTATSCSTSSARSTTRTR